MWGCGGLPLPPTPRSGSREMGVNDPTLKRGAWKRTDEAPPLSPALSPTPNPSPVKREGLTKRILTLPLFTGGRAGLGGFLKYLPLSGAGGEVDLMAR